MEDGLKGAGPVPRLGSVPGDFEEDGCEPCLFLLLRVVGCLEGSDGQLAGEHFRQVDLSRCEAASLPLDPQDSQDAILDSQRDRQH